MEYFGENNPNVAHCYVALAKLENEIGNELEAKKYEDKARNIFVDYGAKPTQPDRNSRTKSRTR